MFRTFLFLAFLLAIRPAVRSQEASTKAYEKAYGYILDEKWKDAKSSLEDYVKKYEESDMIDAARYWLCYSTLRLETRTEVAFECYREFIGEYPDSKWADDARSSMVGLASQLAREGKPEYEAMLKNLDESADEDVQLAALYALANMGSDKAFSTVVTLYDQTKSENIRSKIVYVLGNFDTKESRKKLSEIALNDRSSKVRRDAVYAIGNDDSPEVVEVLKKILNSKADLEVRKAAIYSIGSHSDGDGAAIAYL
ncbi:MAG TPA: HEAT repeat domain-containing protein, partial [Bacteroidota bacterium]|nr:HEAT repeat domain-containing protein [Bacteroidota bacterium]